MNALPLVLVGLLLPVMLSAQTASLPPPPGRLVAVDGQKVHLLCSGQGSPTVVIEAGASSFAIDFSLVQPAVARTTRVCSYDRLGHGWSDPGDGRDAGVADLLHKLLDAAGESAPYVMVGASRGGLYVRDFANRFPDEVVGLVLIDPSSEERLFTAYQGESILIAHLTAEQLRSTLTPGPPIPIPRRQPQMGAPFDLLPRDLYDLRVALDQRLIDSFPDSVAFDVVAVVAEEERAFLAELWRVRNAAVFPLGDRPLIVLSRGADTNDDRIAAFDGLTRLSRRARHTVVPGAGHEIHLFRPEAVIEAIEEVVVAVRSGGPLAGR